MLSANYYPYGCHWEEDGFEFPHELYCDVCGSAHIAKNKENLSYVWHGIGPEEHCWKCGAEPVHHDPFYVSRFDNWRIDFIFDELKRVEESYCSGQFMTREQIGKNRAYLRTIIDAIHKADTNHWANRYEDTMNNRVKSELFIRINQLAILKQEGDRDEAVGELQFMSMEMDDLCMMLDELEKNLKLPPSHCHY